MFWKFPISVPTFDSSTGEKSYTTFNKDEFTDFVKAQFKLPGKYDLKDVHLWQEAGITYAKSRPATSPNFEGGRYTFYLKNTFKWKEYWNQEKEKVLNGYIVNGIYIPPFYYNYLNFCPIYNDVEKEKKLGNVWDGDLWFFHYIMLCMLTGKHAVVVKARQRGYSFKIMSILYWSYCWIDGSVNTIGASKEEYTDKSWRFLEFYRKHINNYTAWRRGPVQPKHSEWLERTYLKNGDYVGKDSKLSSTTFKIDPFNGVGRSQTIFFYEEAGIAPTILETIGAIRPALEKGNLTTGLIIVSGSVGDLDDCRGLKELFYNCDAHNFLSIDNIWDKKSNNKKCGLFVSEAYNLTGFIDENGNSLVDKATEFVLENNEKVRTLKKKELAQLDISQKPLSPEDAFAQRNLSEFPIEELARQQSRIQVKEKENKWAFKPIKCLLYEDDEGKVRMKTTDLPPEHEYPIKPEWEDKRGVVTIYEPPMEGAKWLTYFAGVDTVEVDETTSSESIHTVDIYRRAVKVKYKDDKGKIRTRIDGGKIVATYRGRFNPVEKHNEQSWFLIKLYNAFAYVERSKPNFINYMKRNNRAEKYLAKEVDVPINKDLNIDTVLSSSSYGFIITNQNKMWNILKGTVKEFFATEFDRIEDEEGKVYKTFTGVDRTDDYWLLEEYIKYDPKFGNYDRIVSHAAALLIGKTYENEFGIPTISEVQEEKTKPVMKMERQPQSFFDSPTYRKPYSLL